MRRVRCGGPGVARARRGRLHCIRSSCPGRGGPWSELRSTPETWRTPGLCLSGRRPVRLFEAHPANRRRVLNRMTARVGWSFVGQVRSGGGRPGQRLSGSPRSRSSREGEPEIACRNSSRRGQRGGGLTSGRPGLRVACSPGDVAQALDLGDRPVGPPRRRPGDRQPAHERHRLRSRQADPDADLGRGQVRSDPRCRSRPARLDRRGRWASALDPR